MVAENTTPPAAAGTLFRLEKAHIDLGSVKIQMLLGTLLILLASFTVAWRHLGGDLASEVDAHVLEETSRRLTTLEFGDPQQPQPYAYPVSPVWFLSSIFLLETGIQGSRLVNTGIVAVTCVLVALIALEITGRYGNRLGATAAIWAGLLFAVHPVHAAVQNMVAATGLLLAAMLYLGAFWTYLRYRLLREMPYLGVSLILCFLAFLLDFRTLTLPLAILVAEYCLYRPSKGLLSPDSLKVVAPYVVPTAMFALLAAIVPSFLPISHIHPTPEPAAYVWRALPMLLPFQFSAGAMTGGSQMVMLAYLGCLSVFAARVCLRSLRPAAFVLATALTAILTSTVMLTWNIAYPLQAQNAPLYLATAPVCVLLALAALPAVDAVNKPQSRWLTMAGAISLGTVFAFWSGFFLTEVYNLL